MSNLNSILDGMVKGREEEIKLIEEFRKLLEKEQKQEAVAVREGLQKHVELFYGIGCPVKQTEWF